MVAQDSTYVPNGKTWIRTKETDRMQVREPKLRIYMATGVIGCKCEACGWTAKTSYVSGETAHQTATREFGNHICPRPAVQTEGTKDSTLTLAKQ